MLTTTQRCFALSGLLLAGACDKTPPENARPPATTSAAVASSAPAPAASVPVPAVDADILETTAGKVVFHPIHHATLWMDVAGKIVWVDPWSKAKLEGPKADVVLITDVHPDHLDTAAIDAVKKPGASVLGPKPVADKLPGVTVVAEGQERDLGFMKLRAIPAYNLTRGPAPGKVFHDKGRGVGYVLSVGDKRIYLSGDTECTPEVKSLERIDVAFLCMNLPYTMPPDEAAECARAFKPGVLYPYHFRGSDLQVLTKALDGTGIDVRVRRWYD